MKQSSNAKGLSIFTLLGLYLIWLAISSMGFGLSAFSDTLFLFFTPLETVSVEGVMASSSDSFAYATVLVQIVIAIVCAAFLYGGLLKLKTLNQ